MAAATRKLHSDIEMCFKKVAEKIVEFDATWNKLFSSFGSIIISNMKEKYQDDLKRDIKKLQRYRDQIRAWMLSDEILDKSVLFENRKLIESRMERFKANERETKMKAFSKQGLVSQNLDPLEKERIDLMHWINDSIKTLKVQYDQLESENEQLSTNKKLSRVELDRSKELDFQMNRHAFHIEKLEGLLRMLDNMSVKVEDIETLKENVEYYIESWAENNFMEDLDIYADIVGLNEMVLIGLDVQPLPTLESATPEPISNQKKAVEHEPLTVIPYKTKGRHTSNLKKKQKGLHKSKSAVAKVLPNSVEIINRMEVKLSKGLQTRPLQSKSSSSLGSSSTAQDNNCSKSITFAMVAAIKPPQPLECEEIFKPPVTKTEKLPSLLELHIIPPYTLESYPPLMDRASSTSSSDLSLKELEIQTKMQEQRSVTTTTCSDISAMEMSMTDPKLEEKYDVDSRFELTTEDEESPDDGEKLQTKSEDHSSVETPNLKPKFHVPSLRFGPKLSGKEYKTVISLEASSDHLPAAVDSGPLCPYLPPIPVVIPSYYPQSKEEIIFPSPRKFYDKLDACTLFFLFYYAENSLAQLLAARALKGKGWRYHTLLCLWFRRCESPTEFNPYFEMGKYLLFDPTNLNNGNKILNNFMFFYHYLEELSHDDWLDKNQI